MLNDLLAFDGKHVKLETLDAVKEYLRKINRADIAEIVWVRGGEEVSAKEGAIEEWKFIGMNNTDYPYVHGI